MKNSLKKVFRRFRMRYAVAMKIHLDAVLIFWLWAAALWLTRAFHALNTLRFAPKLTPVSSPLKPEKVSILVPAKNEETNIRACVEDLLNQNYPNFEIIVINDNSTDRTEEILKDLGAHSIDPKKQNASSEKLRYFNSPPAPSGWTGKNHALSCGTPFAGGDWLLFTDADTRHTPEALSASMAFMNQKKIVLLTLLPRCLAQGFWEVLVQPVAMAFMGLWFPVEKANDPASSVYFGNGQYLLISREVYEKNGGHAAVRAEFLEDFAIFKKTKQAGLPCAVAVGTDFFGTRMYDSFARMWRGWRRIYLHAFERKVLPLAIRSLALFLFSVLTFLGFTFMTAGSLLGSQPNGFVFLLSLGTVVIALTTAWKAYQLIGAPKQYAWLHPLAGLVLAGILFDAAFMALTKKETKWR